MNDTDNEIMISNGGPVKSLPERGPGWFGGDGIIFSTANDPDLVKEFFTPRTDIDLYEGQRVRVYFRHGVDPLVGRTKLTQATFKRHEKGIWFEGRLDVSNPLQKRIDSLVQRGKLGLSTGTMGHLTHREKRGEAWEILEWPVGELSLTPAPAEPRTKAVPLKSLIRDDGEWSADLSESDLDEWERKQAAASDLYIETVRKARPGYVKEPLPREVQDFYNSLAEQERQRFYGIKADFEYSQLQRMIAG